MKYSAAVITISDKGARGERKDTSGPALCKMLGEADWEVEYTAIVPDDAEDIKAEIVKCADEKKISLIVTTGGTGFSPRDITPEATLAVIERETRGIPEAMRAASMQITSRGCLSRGVAGIRKSSLIVNLPGSEKASTENLASVLSPVRHGVDMLLSAGSADCAEEKAVIKAVCISEKKGEQKHPVEEVELLPNHGIVGDAHAGNWHRQVSLLSLQKIEEFRARGVAVEFGALGENLIVDEYDFRNLPVGTKFRCNDVLLEMTQIGKECHSHCEIYKVVGDCIMPREGVFAKVLQGGTIKVGDELVIVE